MPREIDEEELQRRYDAGERNFTHLKCLTCDASLLILRGVDFSKVFFTQFCGDKVDLSNSKILNARFFQAGFDQANLSDCDLSGSVITETSFRKANLRGVKFNNAKLREVDFLNADIEDASFEGALFCDVRMADGSYRNENCEQMEEDV